MGKFTALDDPVVDQVVEGHMRRIVSAITTQMQPDSIILRGSFGRGEGSVMLEGGQLRFLSDYEIDVATFSPFHRSLFARLTSNLSEELGMDAGVRWTRPDCLVRDRIGPIPLGSPAPSISLYELRYGSQVLYGEDFLSAGPGIDPACIPLSSAIQLLLNRMAESLHYMPTAGHPVANGVQAYHWINKTVLACAESLLVLWKQYHYSYRERGRRFAALAPAKLGFMPKRCSDLQEFVARATEFKLRPRPDLYPDGARQTWLQIIPACEDVYRHLLQQARHISFDSYMELPEKLLRRPSAESRIEPGPSFAAQKAYELYRCARARILPRNLFSDFQTSQVVYSVVPLLFAAYGHESQASMLEAARRWLSFVGPLPPPSSDLGIEWENLSQRLFSFWKAFCY
jgi:hypothetical protein